MRRAYLRLWAALLALLLHPAAAAGAGDPSTLEARLSYAQDPSRLTLLGNLTVGGTPASSVCLCTDRDPGASEACVDLAATCTRPGGAKSHALPAALSNGHQVRPCGS